MTRFSLGREDDYDGSSSPDPKRQCTTTSRPPPLSPQYPNRNAQESLEPDSAQEQAEDFVLDEEEDDDFVLDEEDDDDFVAYREDDEEEEEGDNDDEEEEEEEEDEGVEIREEGQRGKGKVNEERSESSQSARFTGDDPISVIISDPDVLDCPICLETLTAPVFQCENGHVACNCCCSKIKNTCPSCSMPIGYNRCRAIEKVIESIKISCQNKEYGCKETVSYSKKHDHQHACLHTPASCPYAGCSFVNSSKKLYQHFSSKHSNSATRFSYNTFFSVSLMKGSKHVILQEKNEGIIFILNYGRQDIGTVVNVNCIGPTTTNRGYLYDLKAKNGVTSVAFQSVTKNVSNWVEHIPRTAFLVVPREFDGPFRNPKLFNLEVQIRRPS